VTPVVTFMDADKALEEAKWIIENGSKVVLMRPAPVAGIDGYRSMASPEFDAIWKLLEEHNIFVTFHTSDNGYNDVHQRHKAVAAADGEEYLPFDRFPRLNISYVETGTGCTRYGTGLTLCTDRCHRPLVVILMRLCVATCYTTRSMRRMSTVWLKW